MKGKLISKIFFVRHGATLYKEYFLNEKVNDLVPKGIRQIRKTAEKLVEKINKNLPIIIVSSPRVRTKNSAEIIKNFFILKGIKIVSNKILETKTLEAIRLKGDLIEASNYIGKNYNEWLKKNCVNNSMESSNDFLKRVRKSLTKAVGIIRKNNNFGNRDSKQIIFVSHGEILDGILVSFNKIKRKYDRNRIPKHGEIVEIQIFSKKVKIKYRNKRYLLKI